jgi:Ni/Fe-hydrogenase 1 B-type cytochrome subunit
VGHGGHNPLAGSAYLGMILLSLLMIVSGLFLLFPENSTWVAWGKALFGTQQMARMVHYFLFWIFMIFSMVHMYLVLWNEIFGTEAIVSSIFSGKKFLHKDHH